MSLLNLLPMVAGTAVGTMFGMPWLGAAISGGGTALMSGDLTKGAMAGLGAYGLGSLAGTLGEAGAAAMASQAPVSGALSEAAKAVGGDFGGDIMGNMASQAVQGGGITNAAANATSFADLPFMDQMSAIGQGASFDGVKNWAMANPRTAAAGGLGALGLALSSDEGSYEPGSRGYTSNYRTNYGRGQRSPMMPGPGYAPGRDQEFRYFASGGPVMGNWFNEMTQASGGPPAMGSWYQENLRPGTTVGGGMGFDGGGLGVAKFVPPAPVANPIVQGIAALAPLAAVAAVAPEVFGGSPGVGDPGSPDGTGSADGGVGATDGGPSGPGDGGSADGSAFRKGGRVYADGGGIRERDEDDDYVDDVRDGDVEELRAVAYDEDGEPIAWRTYVERKRFAPNYDVVGYADGGGVMNADMQQNIVAEAKMALMGMHPQPKQALARFERMMGPQALQQLMMMAKQQRPENAVRGPGGGRDDLVPAVVDGQEPVMLSSGEHIIPAAAVSAIGGGDSAQGHRKLEEMTSRVAKPSKVKLPA